MAQISPWGRPVASWAPPSSWSASRSTWLWPFWKISKNSTSDFGKSQIWKGMDLFFSRSRRKNSSRKIAQPFVSFCGKSTARLEFFFWKCPKNSFWLVWAILLSLENNNTDFRLRKLNKGVEFVNFLYISPCKQRSSPRKWTKWLKCCSLTDRTINPNILLQRWFRRNLKLPCQTFFASTSCPLLRV